MQWLGADQYEKPQHEQNHSVDIEHGDTPFVHSVLLISMSYPRRFSISDNDSHKVRFFVSAVCPVRHIGRIVP